MPTPKQSTTLLDARDEEGMREHIGTGDAEDNDDGGRGGHGSVRSGQKRR